MGLNGTYLIQTNSVVGDLEVTVPVDLITEEAYLTARARIYRELPLIALGLFGLVVAGVVVGNLLVEPEPR